jgi:hypothetical protein
MYLINERAQFAVIEKERHLNIQEWFCYSWYLYCSDSIYSLWLSFGSFIFVRISHTLADWTTII